MDTKLGRVGAGNQFKRIVFVPARNPDAHSIDAAALGLVPLNDPVQAAAPAAGSMGRPRSKPARAQAEGPPAKELFKEEDLAMTWTKMRRAGAGLINLGNTCFMNSVLQCLLHTPPLAELLLSGRRLSGAAPAKGFDAIGSTRDLLLQSFNTRHGVVSPRQHASNLKKLSRSFRLGRQEDAHEYLIAMLDAMHERSLLGLTPRPPPALEMTSFVYRIFGGRIRSQVKCTQCGYESNTYDPFLDLSLEITHASSVERALQRFTHREVLDGSNKYKCPREKRSVRAEKRMSVETAPNVLVVQLKRFEFSLSGRKLSKPVSFSETLDLAPAMSRRTTEPVLYDLYGVLVHQGHSMHSGHYFCFVKGAGGAEWLRCDDTRVHTTSVRNVLGQCPYMLFYIKRGSATQAGPVHRQIAAAAAAAPPAKASKAAPDPPAAAKAPKTSKAAAVTASELDDTAFASPRAAAAAADGSKVKRKQCPHPQEEHEEEQRQQQEQEAAAAQQKRQRKAEQPMPNGTAAHSREGHPQPGPASGRGSSSQAGPDPAPKRRRQQAADPPEASALPAAPLQQAQGEGEELADADLGLPAANEVVRPRRRAKRNADGSPAALSPRPRHAVMARSPGLASLGRRGKRLQEQMMLGEMVRKRPRLAPLAAAAAAAEPPVTRRRTADFVSGMASADAPVSVDSAIFAPDWPPLKRAPLAAPAAPAPAPAPAAPAAVPTKAPPAPTGRRAERAAVKDFLKDGGAGGSLGVDAWDTVEIESKRQHDRLMRRAGAQRRPLDEYDAEYDAGRVKKVRTKPRGSSGLDAGTFDEAFKFKQASGVHFELHGKKKQRAMQASNGSQY